MASRILAGRYELLDKIGEGGMAVVFKAQDRLLNRFVAVKILRPEFTKDAVFIDSFRRESQMAAGLTHPNIVNIYDVGKEGNIYYIIMELMEGRPLSEIIKESGSLDPRLAANITRQIAMALSSAHKNKLIHRDVKPHNIMFAPDGTAKITDFGIAKKVTGETLVNEQKENVMGSVHYFSPEQAKGGYVDEKSDIYSLGICLYEMLTGKVPFDGETAVEVAVKHMNEKMVPPTQLNSNIPQDLEEIVLKATAKNPENRFKTADEMITALNFASYTVKRSDEEKSSEKEFVQYVSSDEYIHQEAYKEPKNETPKYAEKLPTDGEAERAEVREELRKARHAEQPKKTAQKSNDKKSFFLKPQRYIAVVLAVLLAIPASLGIYSLFDGEKAEKDDKQAKVVEVAVPSVEGMTVADATKALEEKGLKLEIDLELVSKDVPEGTIMSQTPSAETVIKSNQTVRVNVSKGNVDPEVPNLAGKSLSSARTILQSYNYNLIVSSYKADNKMDKDFIISQEPAVGTTLASGGNVYVVVSSGKEATAELDIIGRPFADARTIIQDAGYSVGLTQNKPSQDIDYGNITSYTINGSTVDLVISSGLTGGTQTDTPTLKYDGTITYVLDYSSHKSEISEDAFTVNISISDANEGSRTLRQSCTVDAGNSSLIIQGAGTDGSITIYNTDPNIMVQLIHANFTDGTYTVSNEIL